LKLLMIETGRCLWIAAIPRYIAFPYECLASGLWFGLPGICLLAAVAASSTAMRRHRSQLATPDLFSTEVVRGALPQVSAAMTAADRTSQRHVLPKDLPSAVKHLTDTELDLLITASVEEAKRRGRLPPSVKPSPPVDPERSSSSKDKRRAELTTISLTRGQVNAVRASFKAGIPPSRIARQFGISQSDVRKVLASDTASQKGA
jgi:hypothetical protein